MRRFALALAVMAFAVPAPAQFIGRVTGAASATQKIYVVGSSSRVAVEKGETRWVKVASHHLAYDDTGVRRWTNLLKGTRWLKVDRAQKTGRITWNCYGKNSGPRNEKIISPVTKKRRNPAKLLCVPHGKQKYLPGKKRIIIGGKVINVDGKVENR